MSILSPSLRHWFRLVAASATLLAWGLPGRAAGAGALPWEAARGYRSARVEPGHGGRTGFQLLDNSACGIRFTNVLPLAQAKANNNLMNGAGVAAGDYDQDGLVDLYFCNLGGRGALYRNLGGWQFEDVTLVAGVGCTNQASTGAVFADLNGDGWPDLLVTSCGGPNACFFNDGHGHFTDVTREAGLLSKAGSTSMALADIDGDGDLDLYVANYAALSILRSGGAISVRRVNGEPVVTGPYADRIRIVDGKMVELGEPDVLYLNDGKGVFTPVPWTDGHFLDEDGKPLATPPQELGLSVMFHDLNGDGAPDLYVCNDYEGPDRIWINDGRGRFHALPRLAIRTTSQFSMSVDVADLNRDGYYDIFVADMLSRFHRLRMTQMGVIDPPRRPVGLMGDRTQARRNTLQLGRADGTYAEVGQQMHVDASDWTWCGAFIDVDLDGYEDLLVVNGHPYDIQDIDAQEELQRRGPVGSIEAARDALMLFPRLETPNYAFHNREGKRFDEVGRDWGFNSTSVSHGIALADLDNDGDLDVVVSCLNAPPLLYRNESTAPRVGIRLRGEGGNRDGIGGRIQVKGGGPVQTQEILSGGRYLSSDAPMRSFAASAGGAALEIEVLWRSGRRSVVAGAEANRVYEIEERGASAPSSQPIPAAPPPMFEEFTARLAHVHHEDPFDDFARQPLLPRRLSQLGPGVAWFDLDGDGHEDLIIGSGKGGSLAGYRGDGRGGFTRWEGAPFDKVASADQTSILGWDAGGSRSLLVGRAVYEEEGTRSPGGLQYSSTNAFASSVGRLPASPTSIGPMALGDVEGDGTLELFAGGRVIPGRYPEPAASRLFRAGAGRWNPDPAVAGLLGRVGLVSGALFSDLDGDGFPELVVACEWGPIRVFTWAGGGFRELTAELGFDRWVGWWTGVTAVDLDGDGRLDLVAGNWGLNTLYHASASEPVQLYYGDLRGGGGLELIEGEPGPAPGTVVPRRDLVVLGAVLPQLRGRFPSHQAFSGASIPELLQATGAGEALHLSASTLESMVFLNRGGRFEARPLPDEVQRAPVFGISVADVDGDGKEDLFLAQNFFATAPSCRGTT
ncbi:MAG TPA: hypothetical protein DCM86_09295, partial [Verrucomicrobiales bacterium]|nr:hypothetical protein [Verrucomicrobiales bacterium]